VIVGFSKHGRGRAARAVAYLTAEETPNGALKYVLGERNRAGAVRHPAPVILRGDPKLIASVIDNSSHQWRYTSGVLSFAPGEQILPAQEKKLMDEFEGVAFAGLTPARYAILWVRHAHAGHPELHFIIPRTELLSGKSLNIAPPGRKSRALFDLWRSKVNAEYGLAEPDDPARRRSVSLPTYIAKLKDRPGQNRAAYSAHVREFITGHIEAKIREGLVKNRADVIRVLQQAGFAIPRHGKDYLTVQHPGTGERFRLRGGCYQEGQVQEKNRVAVMRNQPDPQRAAEFARQLEPLREARARYNRERYGDLTETRDFLYDRIREKSADVPQTIRREVSGARPGVCRHAEDLDRATRNLERAGERLGHAHRALERDYEAALNRASSRHQVKSVLREYSRALEQDIGGDELEREIER